MVTSSPERQTQVRTRYPDTTVLGSVDYLLTRMDDIDLVVVSTPNSTHVPIADAVLSCGRPVVVDKPVTPSVDATRQLAAVAESMGTTVVPFHNRRWDGDFRTVQAAVASGELGPCIPSNRATSVGNRRSIPAGRGKMIRSRALASV